MAFGQQGGPPATARQLRELTALLEQAGYAGFRDARGPLGFTQRQGNGKFTADEAAAIIERLEAGAEGAAGPAAELQPPEPPEPPEPRVSARPRRPVAPVRTPTSAVATTARLIALVKDVPPAILAAELERQGWIVVPPEGYVAPAPPPLS